MKHLATALAIVFSLILSAKAQDLPGWPECEPKNVTWHPHPYTCTKYIICYHGNAIERLCAPGLHFNRVLEQCMFPQLARCDINYACPDVDDKLNPVFLPDPTDCSKYFVCYEGSPIARECAADLWWDVVYNWCTIADDVTCDSRVPNDPNRPETTPSQTTPTAPPPTTQPPTTAPPTTPPSTAPPTTPPPTTQPTTPAPPTTTPDPNTYECPLSADPSFHPHSRDCSLYFICINGVAFLRQCAERMFFDIISRQCEDQNIATCISGNTGIDGDIPRIDIPKSQFSCPLHVWNEIALFPHQTKCDRYYLCNKGIAYLHSCAPQHSFDVQLSKCQIQSEAVCLRDL